MTDHVSRETPPAPASAQGVFGDRLPLAERYVGWLADAGTVRGLIGPREVPRLWERHVLNSAAVSELIPSGLTVADIGSGAGLPGLVLALARPDLEVTLVEPLLRRTTFLQEVVDDLSLGQVSVWRGRAEELHGRRTFDVVTSRAVAPLGRLARWSLPLVRRGGVFLPMKGESAAAELREARDELDRLGAGPGEVLTVGRGVVQDPVTVIRLPQMSDPLERLPTSGQRRRGTRGARGAGARRGQKGGGAR